MAEITLVGFYNYMNECNTPLFDKLALPESIDKEILIDTIILKGGEFEPLYLNPAFLQTAIRSWSIKWFTTFERWQQTLSAQYNPIENYDRYEEYTDRRTENATAHDTSTSGGSGSTNNGRSAYNSNADYSKHDNSSSSSSANSTADTTTDVTGTMTHEAHLHGNIGTTRNQEMVSDEIRLRSEFNVYELIADVFIKEFCIMIY